MRALPIIIVIVLIAGIGYLLRNSISGLFTGTTASNDSQTVVLRQSVTPTPTATVAPTATPTPTPLAQTTSISTISSSVSPSPVAANLPTAGPADGFITAILVSLALVGGFRLLTPKTVTKTKIDIL